MAKKIAEARDIGIDVSPPKETCNDDFCPFHGTLPVRGKVMEGKVVSTKAQGTVVVERTYAHFFPKYERYERRHSRFNVHNTPCIPLEVGDKVKIAECRPLSKTKHFVVVELLE